MQVYITTFMNPQVFGTARRAVEHVINDGGEWVAYDGEKECDFILTKENADRAVRLIKNRGYLNLRYGSDTETIYRRIVK